MAFTKAIIKRIQQPTEHITGRYNIGFSINNKTHKMYEQNIDPKIFAEEIKKVCYCESCFTNDADLLYMTKSNNVIVLAHVCSFCVADVAWAEHVQPGEYFNKKI